MRIGRRDPVRGRGAQTDRGRRGSWRAFGSVSNLLFPFFVPSLARAAASPSSDDGTIGSVVLLILSIAAAYLIAHSVVERLQRRYLVMPGLEYVLLGVLLGPAVPAIHAFEDLAPLMPFIALAAGWVGLLRGTELKTGSQEPGPPGALRLALLDLLMTGLFASVGTYFLLTKIALVGIASRDALLVAGFVGCSAAATASAPVELLARRYDIADGIVSLLRRTARLGDFFVILVFGVLFCVFHVDHPEAALRLRPTEWAVVSIGLGMVLGLLFSPFLGYNESANGRFLALVGITTFASGAAWFLRLDPLLVNLMVGLVIVNTARRGPRVRASLESTEPPLVILLLVIAGALWRPTELEITLLATAGFVALRWIGRMVGNLVAALGTPLRADLFRGLLGHGKVSIAMAISFRLVYEGPAVDLAYSVVLASIVFHDLIAPRMLRALLVDTGALRPELPARGELEARG